ncbi:MAG TPA: phosphonate ABC transporter ATP-binding protein [Nitrolancea sp.]|nr:phosphonate ABC transporter ATP-binding protein [Nitrolancea sp.]
MQTGSYGPLLELRGITKYYQGKAPSLVDASFTAAEGEFVSIIGRSGAGKSTLLRCINRMIDASSGEVIFDGIDVMRLGPRDLRKVRTKIGMVFQHFNLVNRLTVVENVLHGRLGHKSTLAGVLGRYSQEEKRQAFRLIRMLGLDGQVYQRCDQLSGGQKQRTGIARALIQNPRMVLCDEPIASLDPNAAKIIMDHLRTASNELGITIIVVLQQVDVALKYSDRIIGVSDGRIVFNGPPAELTNERIAEVYGSEYKDLLVGRGEADAG